jgi:hypothetical protein
MSRSARILLFLAGVALSSVTPSGHCEDLPEYRLKAAFLYNFMLFTEWPATVGPSLNLCIFGNDPFGAEIDPLQGKQVGGRGITLQRKTSVDSLKGCQVVFIVSSSIGSLPRMLDALRGEPVLTVADSPGAAAQGVALNMNVVQNKIVFDANLRAARNAGVTLSSKLLRLAAEVSQ